MIVNVRRHGTGQLLGSVEIGPEDAREYAAGEHPDYRWPEGVAVAGDVLDDDQREACGGVSADVAIYLEV